MRDSVRQFALRLAPLIAHGRAGRNLAHPLAVYVLPRGTAHDARAPSIPAQVLAVLLYIFVAITNLSPGMGAVLAPFLSVVRRWRRSTQCRYCTNESNMANLG